MPAPQTLKEVYLDELADLWSANEQMQGTMQELSQKAHEPRLKKTLETSVSGIAKHTATLKAVLEANGGKSKEHCRGMEGLIREAKRHAQEIGSGGSELGDLTLIAQYQRMSHYGLAGFGTAASYAKALGRSEDETKLKTIVSDIYKADEYSTRLAERLEKVAKAQ